MKIQRMKKASKVGRWGGWGHFSRLSGHKQSLFWRFQWAKRARMLLDPVEAFGDYGTVPAIPSGTHTRRDWEVWAGGFLFSNPHSRSVR